MSRFIVGIDLGTTNTAVAAIDTEKADTIEMVSIPQVIAPGQVEARPTLPSFLYLPGPSDLPEGALALPWQAQPADVVGELARARGAEVPARLVASSKSWLCHPRVDRTASILPWGAGDEIARVSPVTAGARFLEHIAMAWQWTHPEAPLAGEDVLLTVPASFDAVARELTMQAAQLAGLGNVTLLEEPQAAFYSWLAHAGDRWRKELAVGDVVLVCDIGGGTTDFTLISVSDLKGDLALERIAVGDHILLGGDNMDLALAYSVSQKLATKGTKLDSWQERALTQASRAAKEVLLADTRASTAPIAILGRSSKLIGGTIKTNVDRADLEASLLDGFFPACSSGDRPHKSKRIGFQELGLPYATDPAITRHLAEFLGRHGEMPTAVLYNGGVMKGAALKKRLGEILRSWAGPGLRELVGTDLDLAVAHGAAYYGLVRRGRGIRIRGGAARSYYLGIETAMPAVPGMAPPLKALCVVPFGMEEGTEASIPNQELGLVVGEPAEFRFFCSSVRKDDILGALITDWQNDFEELASIEANLPATEDVGPSVPVTLHTHLTAVGTLELWCVAKDRRWKLEYQIRGKDS